MNGLSSNNTDRHLRQQSSLDALSRTIEGLEARIESLVSRQTPPSRPDRVAAGGVEHGSPHRPAEKDVSEIVRRQRLLEQERASLRSRLDRDATAPDSRKAEASEQTLRDIAEALVSLRAELRHEIGEGLGGELSALRQEVAALGSPAERQSLPPELRGDLVRLADCIERLGERTGEAQSSGLRGEFDTLLAAIDGVAADAVARTFERQQTEFEERLVALDPSTLRTEIVGLADRIEALGQALAELPGSLQTAELERGLTDLASTVEALAGAGQPGISQFEEAFVELGERLDEISRAIVAVGARVDRSGDGQALARLESRMAGIARQIDGLVEHDAVGDLAMLVEALASRVDGLASAESVRHLGDHLDQLSTLINEPAHGDLSELTEHLVDISSRIGTLEQGDVNATLAERLDGLAERIDDLAASAGLRGVDDAVFQRLEALVERAETSISPVPLAGMDLLEERLADIARRLDETQHAVPDSEAALRSLEAQIANLSDLMSRSAVGQGDGGALLEPRLAAIEEHLATNDEYVIEAARQAAEAVVEAYGRGTVGGAPANSSDLAVISELAEDLRALEELNRDSDLRTARAFDAVHDTLVKIAEHLEKLDPAYLAASAPAFGEATAVEGETMSADEDADRHGSEPIARQAMTPAAAAAEAAVFAANGLDDDEAGTQRSGFFAGLGRRARPPRRDPVIEEEHAPRRDVDDAPSIDPSATFDPVSANEPLEPGSGAPDISRIIQKVRESQAGDVREPTRSEAEKADFIAAARRAAQAAAAEVETIGGDAKRRKGRGLAEILKRRRKPILMAVGAVLLAVMSWPLVSALLTGTPARNVASGSAKQAVVEKADVTQPAPKASPSAPASASKPLPQVRVLAKPESSVPSVASISGTPGDPAATPGEAKPANRIPAETAATTPTAANPAGADREQGAPAPVPPTPLSAKAASPAAVPAASSVESSDGPAPVTAAAPADTASAEPEVPAVPAVPEAIGPASLRVAAEKGDPVALFEIGSRYTQGRGVDVDLKTAARWYRAAADRNLAPAEYRLANLYEKGSGVDRDVEAAKDWYRKAAEAGNASAMHNLAVLHAMGTDGKAEYETASGWFEKAANYGVHDSQFNLGILYAQGHGVPRDLAQSYKWFAIAASTGDKDAAEKRDQVADALDAGALEKAKAVVASWKAKPLDPAANTVDIPAEWSGVDTHTASVDMTKAVRNIQAILNNNGFDAGKPDGIMGDRTRSAIKAFQKSVGQEPTGEVTDALIKELLDRNATEVKA